MCARVWGNDEVNYRDIAMALCCHVGDIEVLQCLAVNLLGCSCAFVYKACNSNFVFFLIENFPRISGGQL